MIKLNIGQIVRIYIVYLGLYPNICVFMILACLVYWFDLRNYSASIVGCETNREKFAGKAVTYA